jgi:phenylalanine-4-hydroxylase
MKASRQVLKAIDKIPEHLVQFTTRQNPDLYTPIDHSSWRFIMKLSADFFSNHAHPIYLDGLKATGISVERIPLVEEMDKALRKFGWRAVNVSGFIPPAAFLEFLALGILPIACEMRKVENINYTPAPDIVHEAAGHAPILADKEYADYVKSYGHIASKAIFSKKDLNLFEAIRVLSDIKEKPSSTQEQIEKAQKAFEEAYAKLDYISEATQLARMSWWTIEYGLIGDLNKPLIYGAGLLSSMGESYHCFDDNVKKVPLSDDCVFQSYDITKPQPQLFVSPNIASMKKVLSDFSKNMAFKKGGTYALGKAKHAQSVTTSVFESGLQVTGILKNFSADAKEQLIFLNWSGPLQFSLNDNEIKDWETAKLPNEILSPMGTPSAFTINGKSGKNWDKLKWSNLKGQSIDLRYKNGFKLQAKIGNSFANKGKTLFIEFQNAEIFNPFTSKSQKSEKQFLILAKKVKSVFGGAADRAKYLKASGEKHYQSNSHIANYDKSAIADLCEAYTQLREFRSQGRANPASLDKIVKLLDEKYPKEWLLRWELLEMDQNFKLACSWRQKLLSQLEKISREDAQAAEAISRGLKYLRKHESHLKAQAAHV